MAVENEYAPHWVDDVLNRSECAKFLTKYLNTLYADESDESINSSSFVLCLNAEWGYGKTFLIENWAKDLREHLKHPVVYFDAWQNDFSDDPLLAFVSELEQALKEFEKEIPKGKTLVKGVIETSKGAIAPALKTVANVVLKKVVGADSNDLMEVFTAASEGAIDTYVNNALESHNTRKEKIRDFSRKLEYLLSQLKAKDFKLPMYVFIDELDRCKPSYAIQLLEGVKHIFGTKGLFFIIATNKTQLSKSIKAVYGSEFDSLVYLQRFFDQEYQLPKPDFLQFSKLLIEKIYRLSEVRIEGLEIDYDLKDTFALLAEGFNLSLRAQNHAAKQFKAIALSWSFQQKIHHWYLLFLIMFKIKDEDKYNQFCKAHLNELISHYLKDIFDENLTFVGQVPNGDQFNRTRVSTIDCWYIFDEYRRLEEKNAPDLRREEDVVGTIGRIKTAFFIDNEVPSQYISEKHYALTIAHYKKLLLQAGQLS